MVINVPELIDGDEDYDLVLQDGDELYIPQRPDDVAVLGEVYHPTAQLYQRGTSLGRYIKQSGGVTKKGDKRGIYVVHADGNVSPISRWFRRDPRVGPGDTIIVPLKLDRVSGLKLATDVTQVVYQITVSLATLRTIGVI